MNRLLQATNFAAEKHTSQRRKNADATPYINHPVEVAFHLSAVGKVEDEDILIAALLHDTIEDTETSREEIAALFGESVASLVCECTDDKSLPSHERKRLQIENAPRKSPGAKVIKIADKTCNLRAILSDPPADWSIARQHEYYQWAERVIDGLLGVNQALDDEAKSVLQQGLAKLNTAAQGSDVCLGDAGFDNVNLLRAKTIRIPVDRMKSWRTFHKVFAEVLGFPDFYGENMNAWIDCMTSIDEPGDGMSQVHVAKGEMLVLDLGECTAFAARCPEQYEALLDCTAFVNYRRVEAGEAPVLSLSFWNREPVLKR